MGAYWNDHWEFPDRREASDMAAVSADENSAATMARARPALPGSSFGLDPAVREAMAVMEPKHEEFLTGLNREMGEVTAVNHAAFVSTPADRHGRPLAADPTLSATPFPPPDIEAALERAHQKRVERGEAKSSADLIAAMKAADAAPVAAKPSVLVTLRTELSNMCAKLGEARANYAIQEAAMLRQIEAKAAQVAVAEEMSK